MGQLSHTSLFIWLLRCSQHWLNGLLSVVLFFCFMCMCLNFVTTLYIFNLFIYLYLLLFSSSSCRYQIGKPINRRMIANVPLFLTLTSLGVGFAALYLFLPQPILHHSYYGLLVIISYYLEVRLLKAKRCQICKQLFIFSTFIYLFGFFLWSIDKIYCPQLE